jgi:hypothetical protein
MERQTRQASKAGESAAIYRRLWHLGGKTMSALTAFGTGLIWRAMSGFFVTNSVATRRRRRTCDTARARAHA